MFHASLCSLISSFVHLSIHLLHQLKGTRGYNGAGDKESTSRGSIWWKREKRRVHYQSLGCWGYAGVPNPSWERWTASTLEEVGRKWGWRILEDPEWAEGQGGSWEEAVHTSHGSVRCGVLGALTPFHGSKAWPEFNICPWSLETCKQRERPTIGDGWINDTISTSLATMQPLKKKKS